MSITERPRLLNKPYPAELLAASNNLLQSILQLFGSFPQARMLAAGVLTKYPEHAAQAKEVASELGADPTDVMLANLSYDLLLGTMACSTIALATPQGPVVARNMDWFPPGLIARASVILPTQQGLSAGFIGSVGVVTGLSDKGFCVILNAATNGQMNYQSYPVLLFLRSVLDHANSFDEALNRITETPLMSGGLITLVGSKNDERVVVERTPQEAKIRRPKGDEPIIATNHYRLHSHIPECTRYAWLIANVDRTQNPLDLLTNPNVMQDITAQHILIQPATKMMTLFVPSKLLDPGFHDPIGDLSQLGGLERQG